MPDTNRLLLAGDIGGTKTILALYSPAVGPRRALAKARFPSSNYPSLDVIIAEFLRDHRSAVAGASLGIAGPVVEGRVQATNLPWILEESALSEQLAAPVHFLNDLESIAYAVPHLEAEDLETLRVGAPVPRAPLAVIAPGTGLGEAFLLWVGDRYRAFASEGGHADFAPNALLEAELLAYLQSQIGHVSYEQVCSGRGMPNIYDFLEATGRYPIPERLAAELAGAHDRTPVIVRGALEEHVEICLVTLELFCDVLAAEAGNLALKVVAKGGIYIGGGIMPRLLGSLQRDRFLQRLTDKGRFAPFLENAPVHVIRNPEAALFGAACYGLDIAG
jgi:glucokinase